MSWRLGKSIRLRFQTGLELWRTYSDSEDIKGHGRTLKRISKPQLKRV